MTTATAKAAPAAEKMPATAAHPSLRELDRPVKLTAENAPGWGSDVVADTLRALNIPYIALNPGASYRGLHDSIVNYLGNETPQMILCLHEEIAVAIAQGYAKVTGKAMAAAVHSNVGLFHATMAIFNAWCDRTPVVILGATGPVDAAKRRPWIDWIHTAADQGAIVRDYTKWDDQPASPAAAREAILRATWIANTAPMGPVYINLDAEMQENKLSRAAAADRRQPLHAARPTRRPRPSSWRRRPRCSSGAKNPVILMGRVSRSMEGWNAARRARRAPQRQGHHRTQARRRLPDRPSAACRSARLDRARARRAGGGEGRRRDPEPRLGRSRRRLQGRVRGRRAEGQGHRREQRLPHPSRLEHGLPGPAALRRDARRPRPRRPCRTCSRRSAARSKAVKPAAPKPKAVPELSKDKLVVNDLVRALKIAVGERDVTLAHISLSWDGATWPFRHPLDYVGSEGGGGVGGGPGNTVGTALALKGSGRLVAAVCGDGDFMMSNSAVWTAVHYRIPLLIVVANNRSFFNDELHQERVARIRSRPVENRWIGQRISEPDIDFAALARSQGAQGFGPVTKTGDLVATFEKAIAAVEAGGVAVVDVRVEPGYSAVATAAMLRGTEKK